ncbi:acidic tetraheme cytochrome c3 TmcA [Desulfohalobium retbaense]|uniref:Cytochrome c class III n=1 Tax=Desulfohalobium retbaense (strain ATCC 49708 / DSM 5692 / JCM 16813 / HR100) TaxID=485915 RepID=C8X1Z2_DESRD|nr:cytochrome c3 family protein [Desulfohalobium retbaense]ACV68315.1 cytochrome c class III [Desulfohalobium retbaense DSM 5692]
MVKRIVPFCLAAVMVFAFLLPAFSQMDMTVLSDPAFGEGQRPPAVFEHDAHNEKAELFDCAVCHHYYEDGEKVEGMDSIGMPCSDCHPADPGSDELGLMEAYHTQCIDCHEQEGQGPLACGECHVK